MGLVRPTEGLTIFQSVVLADLLRLLPSWVLIIDLQPSEPLREIPGGEFWLGVLTGERSCEPTGGVGCEVDAPHEKYSSLESTAEEGWPLGAAP